MDNATLIGIGLFVLIMVFIWSARFTKKGKEAIEAKKRFRLEHAKTVAEQKAKGAYKTSETQKSNSVVFLVIIWAGIGFLFSLSAENPLPGISFGAIFGALLGWASSAIGRMAEKKGRSYYAFFWLSALINPILMWIIAAAISKQPAARTSPAAINTHDEATDQIAKLGALKEQGLITKAEFDAKKRELLDRI